MIPIQIDMKMIETNNFNDLEYKYLVEIPQEIKDNHQKCIEDNDEYSSEKKLLQLFTDNGFALYKYLGKIGESNLFFSKRRLYTVNIDKDFIYHDEGCSGKDWCFILTDEVLKDMVGKRFDCGYRGHINIVEIFEKYKNQEIGIGDFIQRFLAYGFKAEREKIEREKHQEIKKEEEIKGNELEIKEFNKGEWSYDDSVYGSKKIIYFYGGEYTFSKDINKVFTIKELNNAYRGYSSYGTEKLNWIETLSVEKKVSYGFVSKDKKRTYSVKFKKDKMYVDKVVVPISRSSFFISRANGDTEILKQFKELSAIKVEFLGLTNISISTDSYSYKNIPIEVKCIDKLFGVTLLDKTIKADWKDLELFRHNIQRLRTRFYTRDIQAIIELFDISKSDMFDFMKKTQLLDKLGEEDE